MNAFVALSIFLIDIKCDRRIMKCFDDKSSYMTIYHDYGALE